MGQRRNLPQENQPSRSASSFAEAVEAEVRFPWIGLALLALLIVGFSVMEWRGAQERDQIRTLTQAVYDQNTEADRRVAKALSSIASIVAAERTVTREIIRSEVQATATATHTITKPAATATVTETETVFRPPVPFRPANRCVELPAGFNVCREHAAAGLILLGFPLVAFGLVRWSSR